MRWCFEDGWYTHSILIKSDDMLNGGMHGAGDWSEKMFGYKRLLVTSELFDIVYFF